VLGSLASPSYWRWTAQGKHPAAGDYFRLGENLPLLQAFAGWVHQGYQALASKRSSPVAGHRSWRFWARGSTRGQLAGGLLKDSSDRHGRPFPLLLVGTGPLAGWEDHWNLVPFAYEGSWNQMERICTRGYGTLREFETEIQKIRAPSPDWSVFQAHKEEIEKTAATGGAMPRLQLEDLEKRARHLSRQSEILISLTEGPTDDQFALVSLWHSLLRAGAPGVPNVVLMGGTGEAAFLILLQRPLGPDDFAWLWSGPAGGRETARVGT
jgi:type VI secretion system protein VasJ